jgi:hypothetical protein
MSFLADASLGMIRGNALKLLEPFDMVCVGCHLGAGSCG